jgi:hypothetical protein
MGNDKYAALPPEVAATELVQLVETDEVPLGPEGGGDSD